MIERLRVRIPAEAAGEFSSPELILCADCYSVSVPHPELPLWHVKDPGHSAKNASGRLHLNTHTPLIQRNRDGLTMLAVQACCGNLTGNVLTCNSSGNTRPQSSQLAGPLWTDPGLKNGISVRELLSNEKKKKNEEKKRSRGMNGRTFSQNPRKRGRSRHHQH